MPKIAASVLNADFSRQAEWLPALEKAKVDRIQWDIMDNKFVPNTGVAKDLIPKLRKKTKIYFESHLMVQKPENYVKEFSENGTQLFIFHVEATKKPLELIEMIKNNGMKAGIAINSKTPAEMIYPFLDKADLALVMSVDAGFGGQKFQEQALEKVEKLRNKIDEIGSECEIEVDGGVNAEIGKKCTKSGADVLVAGSFLFRHPQGIAKAIEELRKG